MTLTATRFDTRDQMRTSNPHLLALTAADWSDLAPSMRDYNYRQSFSFANAAAKRVGATSELMGVFDKSECVAIVEVRVKSIPVIGGGIAYISGGPLLPRQTRELSEHRLDCALAALTNEYVVRRGYVLRVAPPVEWAAEEWNVQPLFSHHQFEVATELRRYRTQMINLSPSVEQLRKNLDQKWRNCLNRAEKNSLAVRAGYDTELLNEFHLLHDQLMERKGFGVDLTTDFYCSVQREASLADKFFTKIIDIDGVAAAGHVGISQGQTSVYLLGASNPIGNEFKASYWLQWQTLVTAKEQGRQWYDLGGIDPDGNPGVYQFKQRMGGIDVTAHGPYERCPVGYRATITRFAESIYRALRKQKKPDCRHVETRHHAKHPSQ